MATSLLETKLFVPRPRRGLVPRRRLTEQLRRGSDSALVLVSAPAGFGKTTLLAEWLASDLPAGEPLLAWVSLDEGDNAPATFWAYVLTALRRLSSKVGVTALELLAAPQPPSIETVLATLINDLAALSHEVVLVLDDYHVIEAEEVHQGLAYLLEHRPSQLHVVVAGRADPPLPLPRLRARDELVEIRAADLRFTAEEAHTYLNDTMGLQVNGRDVARLEGRTEGWIAALKLAALSMQGRDDTAGFIADFAGDDRYVVDYLVEEVLQRQADEVQAFLLQTAVLERMSGPLCDAVTGRSGGQAALQALDRANLFLVPLDDRRRWYRYHHLFADVLRARLLDEQPLLVPELHRRASRWYADHGDRSAAIGHALAAGDQSGAADLIEDSVTEMMSRRQERELRHWLEELPDELVRARPVLHMALVRVLMAAQEPQGVAERLDQIEGGLSTHTGPATEVRIVDREELARLPASVELYRAALALTNGDPSGTVTHAGRATELAPVDADVIRASASALRGLTSWAAGDLEDAHRCYTQCMAGLERAGFIADVLGCATTTAEIRTTQGRLGEALQAYEAALALAVQHGTAVRGMADMHVGIAQILRERGDLPAAREHLLGSQQLGDSLGMPQNPYRWHVAMAQLRQAEGDLAEALTLVDEAEGLYVPDFHPDVRPVPALKARLWAAQGRSRDALAWAEARGLSADDDLSYLREYEHVTLARALLARHRDHGDTGSLRDAIRLLKRLLDEAERGGRTGTVIEILALLALAHRAAGDLRTALTTLGRAVMLGAPEGYVRVFADEGAPMAALLAAAAARADASPLLRRLLEAIHHPSAATLPAPTPAPARSPARAPSTEALVVEPLTEREMAVLRMLGTELDGPQIARELVVSVNTVRTHTKNIYAKLGVTNRRAAVRRARELQLLHR